MAGPTVDFTKLRVLVVESHALMRRILGEMLRGFDVAYVRDARDVPEGLDCVYREDFDVVIVDLYLGKLDGADFAIQVRRDRTCRNREVPILLITGKPDHDKVMKVRSAGVHGMMAKPIASKDLYRRIQALLGDPMPFVVTEDYVGPARVRRETDVPSRVAYARAAGRARPAPSCHSRRQRTW
ncbi:MAG: response regulator [Hyphomicrobiales bacterium]|nr:response regulator [Hyphomicrobiales bacterium]